ncbi:MAG: hypothetical protein GKC04_04465 [Methanomicrobiales archaeon]|nr:hypothetical protein [Methanomicrobiales archaeon]
MAQKDAIIRNLENIIEEKEREIVILKESGTMIDSKETERVKSLEKKIVEIESLVKGLKEELLDLKAIVRKIAQQQEERMEKAPRPRPEVLAGPRTQPEAPPKAGITVAPRKPEAAGSAAAAKKRGDVMIMQSDGTLKPEPRQSEDMIIAGARGIPKKKTGRRTDVATREEEESKPLIYAEDDDTVEIKRRKE